MSCGSSCDLSPATSPGRGSRLAGRVTVGRSRSDAVLRLPDGRLLVAACRDAGMPYATVYQRLRRGWSFDRALSVPVRGYSFARVSRR